METTSERNHINIEDEMRRSYLDYAMSVIIGRALPDVRDGLKPVHRRVLWAMHELGNTYNKAYKKSARIVGDVIGKYHPHGDMPVYDTIVRLAQDFSMRYPLIDGQGNFGSVDGDAAAAMRYTEIRMARLANEVLADIEKETVVFQPNYDESLSEPTVLPARVPNLLISGSDGIAVGMATKIPPHNLTEIVDATLALLKDPETTVQDLTKIVTGPDFPTGGFIYGREEIRKSYEEGRGVLQIRARAGIDRIGRGSQERDAIVITEIPFQVNKARLLERIAELINEKKIDGISDLRDESDRTGMRIVVELKRDAVPQVVLNKLYKLTPMQSSFGVINLAIVNGQPRVLNLKQMLEAFIEFRREVVRKRTEYELRKARARAHILEGLTKAIDALDYIILLIRNSRSVEEARQWLMGQLKTTAEVKTWKGVPRTRAEDDGPTGLFGDPGTGDSRSAIAPDFSTRAPEDHRRIRADHQAHRRVGRDSWQREIFATRDREGVGRGQERLWRRASHGDRRRRRRAFNRRPDCRRRRGDYCHQQWLHQAYADHDLHAPGSRW
jgi:DNA gyrase subunit A